MLMLPLPSLPPLHRPTPPACSSSKPLDYSLGRSTYRAGERAVHKGQNHAAHRPARKWDGPGQEIPPTYLHREAPFSFCPHSTLRSRHFVKLRNPRVLASLCDWLGACGFFYTLSSSQVSLRLAARFLWTRKCSAVKTYTFLYNWTRCRCPSAGTGGPPTASEEKPGQPCAGQSWFQPALAAPSQGTAEPGSQDGSA